MFGGGKWVEGGREVGERGEEVGVRGEWGMPNPPVQPLIVHICRMISAQTIHIIWPKDIFHSMLTMYVIKNGM